MQITDRPRARRHRAPIPQAIAPEEWYTSGQIPLDLATGARPRVSRRRAARSWKTWPRCSPPRAQARPVVKTTCFLADMGDFAVFNQVYAEYFRAPLPGPSCGRKTRPRACWRVEAWPPSPNNMPHLFNIRGFHCGYQGKNERKFRDLQGGLFQRHQGRRGRGRGQLSKRPAATNGLGRPVLPGPSIPASVQKGHAGCRSKRPALPLQYAHRCLRAARGPGKAGFGAHRPHAGPQPQRHRHPRLRQRPALCHDAVFVRGRRGAGAGPQLSQQLFEPQAAGRSHRARSPVCRGQLAVPHRGI